MLLIRKDFLCLLRCCCKKEYLCSKFLIFQNIKLLIKSPSKCSQKVLCCYFWIVSRSIGLWRGRLSFRLMNLRCPYLFHLCLHTFSMFFAATSHCSLCYLSLNEVLRLLTNKMNQPHACPKKITLITQKLFVLNNKNL